MNKCLLCDRPAWARGYCNSHYKHWRHENIPGAKERTLQIDRERAKRNMEKAKDRDYEALKAKWRKKDRAKTSELRDSYIKKLFKGRRRGVGVVNLDDEMIEFYRTYLTLTREVRK